MLTVRQQYNVQLFFTVCDSVIFMMETDLSVNKQNFGDSFLAGVRQHLEAVGRNLEVCEMLEIG